jgi:hypothetical protein
MEKIIRQGPKPPREKSRKCRKYNCKNRAIVDRRYCSAECAPLGRWNDNPEQVEKSLRRLKKLEEEYKDFDDDGIRIVR